MLIFGMEVIMFFKISNAISVLRYVFHNRFHVFYHKQSDITKISIETLNINNDFGVILS